MKISPQEFNEVSFLSLASGSNGNCYWFSNGIVTFLVDFGIGMRTVKKRLSEYSLNLNDVDFVLVTHDHIDHIKHLGSFVERSYKPVYATESLHNALASNFATRGKLNSSRVIIQAEQPFEFKEVRVTPFPVPHDGTDNYGFYIEMSGVKIAIITDIGRVTDKVLKYASMADHLIFESNYDCKMLEEGPYPKALIDRIRTGKGHLSNSETAEAIEKIYHSSLKTLLLCHLSANNNTPSLALQASGMAILKKGAIPGADFTLECLPRGTSSKMYWFK
jgi:phosphoribosyl 1,2-cyclic phosphodiesterase